MSSLSERMKNAVFKNVKLRLFINPDFLKKSNGKLFLLFNLEISNFTKKVLES